MRPIDADALKRQLCEDCGMHYDETAVNCKDSCAFVSVVDEMPTIDIYARIEKQENRTEHCPFCGGRPRFFEYKRTNTEIIMMVECVDCGCTPFSIAVSIVQGEEYAKKAIAEKWNTRNERYSGRWENETEQG